MKKIGLMGGTFDPIHIGHLILGETAYEQFHLDRVVYMPAGNPPHKRHREGRATDEERYEMVNLAIRNNPHFAISDFEMTEDGYSYTYRTLEAIRKKHPDYELYFIIGADSLFDFDTWRMPQRICDNCVLIVATRNHTADDLLDRQIEHVRNTFSAHIEKLESENIDCSSNMIREWVNEGRSIRYYVTDPVIEYIQKHDIYRHLKEAEMPYLTPDSFQ